MYDIPAWLPSFSHLSKNKASLSAVATCAIPQASKPVFFAFSFISAAENILYKEEPGTRHSRHPRTWLLFISVFLYYLKHFELISLFLQPFDGPGHRFTHVAFGFQRVMEDDHGTVAGIVLYYV